MSPGMGSSCAYPACGWVTSRFSPRRIVRKSTFSPVTPRVMGVRIMARILRLLCLCRGGLPAWMRWFSVRARRAATAPRVSRAAQTVRAASPAHGSSKQSHYPNPPTRWCASARALAHPPMPRRSSFPVSVAIRMCGCMTARGHAPLIVAPRAVPPPPMPLPSSALPTGEVWADRAITPASIRVVVAAAAKAQTSSATQPQAATAATGTCGYASVVHQPSTPARVASFCSSALPLEMPLAPCVSGPWGSVRLTRRSRKSPCQWKSSARR